MAPPEPLLEPPVNRSRSQGFRAVSNAWDKLVVPNSVILSLPRRMAPADFSLAITVASSSGTNIVENGRAAGGTDARRVELVFDRHRNAV